MKNEKRYFFNCPVVIAFLGVYSLQWDCYYSFIKMFAFGKQMVGCGGGGYTPIQFVLIDSVGMVLKVETDSVVLLFDDGMIQGKCEWEIPDYFFAPPPFYTITHRAVVEKKTDLVYLEGFFKAGNYSTAFNMDEIKKSMNFQWIVFETPLADYLFRVDTKEMSVMKLPGDLKKLNLASGYTFKYGLLYPDELMLSGHIYTSPQLQ